MKDGFFYTSFGRCACVYFNNNENRAVEALARYGRLAPQSPATMTWEEISIADGCSLTALLSNILALAIDPHDAPALMGVLLLISPSEIWRRR
jgi:hypothetical protein